MKSNKTKSPYSAQRQAINDLREMLSVSHDWRTSLDTGISHLVVHERLGGLSLACGAWNWAIHYRTGYGNKCEACQANQHRPLR